MKILQLTYESFDSPFGFGGAGIRAYEIYKRLKNRHEIILVCMKYPGARDGEIEGLKHVFVGTESSSLPKSVLFYTLKAAGYVRKYGKDYDVIVENFLPATPFFGRFLTKTPVILQIQGVMGLHSIKKFHPLYGLPMYIMEKIYPRLYDRFIFVTDLNADRLIKKSKKSLIIPNGVNRELLHVDKNREEDYILFFSRIDTYTKGLNILIDAFRLISDKFSDVRLIFAGYEFNSTDELFRVLEEKHRRRVSYAGFVSGKEKIKLLSRAKVFVFPSRHEAHPVSVLEALACGKAVIVSDIPELRHIGEEKIGLTFKSGSSRDLSEKLSLLLKDSELRQSLGDRGRKYASQFLWDDVSLRFEKFLFNIVDREG
ncbi:MAG: glycosyltransferase family 4 protein [Thermodesulfovibrionia bacterium]|nr:MAG: glycosyltransferase family 4 protein [Thermodesulfovibrionia bacterium]